jgi:hypothetical protein
MPPQTKLRERLPPLRKRPIVVVDENGVTQDQTIQAILRHSKVQVTQACYIKTVNQDSVRAMAALDSVLCSTCALDSAVPGTYESAVAM